MFAQNPRRGLHKNGQWREESGDATLRGNAGTGDRGAGEDETHEDIVPSAGVQDRA